MRKAREKKTRANRRAATNLSTFIFVRSYRVDVCDSYSLPSLLLLHPLSPSSSRPSAASFSTLAGSPTNDAPRIYDPVNSFYSAVKSA